MTAAPGIGYLQKKKTPESSLSGVLDFGRLRGLC